MKKTEAADQAQPASSGQRKIASNLVSARERSKELKSLSFMETWLFQDNVVAEMMMHVTPDPESDENNPVSSSELQENQRQCTGIGSKLEV